MGHISQLKGECKRSSCRFRHLSPMQYDIEMSDYFQREYFQREQQQIMHNQSDLPEYEYERRQQIRQDERSVMGRRETGSFCIIGQGPSCLSSYGQL